MTQQETADITLKVLQRIQEDVSGLKGGMASMRSDLASIKADVAALKENTAGIPEMVRDIHELLGYVARHADTIQDHERRIKALEARAH